ncbi:uncharacterized protein LOC113280965 isoform X5 [Papaver somniferum]|uniref:uncharacterized protein LOC113280965 isoform X5 n=1 Tax=Papaver somniferum TaxID=3469 RepID=UPI000E703587|nr:uncharacterized protein LOC113280965 isoform X5 [Papaver somniferum]
MINKQQAIVDGSIEPGGFQTSQNSDVNIQIDVARDSDEHMMESEVGTEGMQNDQQRIEEDGFGLQNNQPLKQGPLKPISYRDLFKNSNESWKNCFKEWGFQEIDLEFEEGHTSMDSTTEEDDGIPIISLDLENKKRIIQPWKYCLIGKVVGKTVGYKFLSFKANAMWKLSGPWFIVGHHLSLRRWKPDFKPSEASVNTTVVWARLPELPLEYFDKTVLEKVGAKIGRLIKVDATTEHVLRGKFARVCVEVSTDKPLVPLVKIGRVLQKVEYEGDPKTVNLEDSYGPWMIVEKKKKKIKGSIPVVKTGSLMAVG